MEGGGIGWMKTSRIRKLMEDENYRNFVLSRLNGHLDKKLSSNDNQVVEDVVRILFHVPPTWVIAFVMINNIDESCRHSIFHRNAIIPALPDDINTTSYTFLPF